MSTQKNKIIILGSGTSTGIPMATCKCKVCQSTNPKNQRLRTSILIQTKSTKNILVDAGPDLRAQVLSNNIDNIDAVVITHDHADHVHGIDDLRPFCFNRECKTIPLYTSAHAADILTDRFAYIFQAIDRPSLGGGIPQITLHHLPIEKKTKILDEDFTFFLLPHGYTRTLSFIHDKMGYIADCEYVSDAVVDSFNRAKLDTLIINCIKRTDHETHLHLDQALGYIDRIGAKFSGLIHLTHDFEHTALTKELDSTYHGTVAPVYDGLTLEYGQI